MRKTIELIYYDHEFSCGTSLFLNFDVFYLIFLYKTYCIYVYVCVYNRCLLFVFISTVSLRMCMCRSFLFPSILTSFSCIWIHKKCKPPSSNRISFIRAAHNCLSLMLQCLLYATRANSKIKNRCSYKLCIETFR